MLFLNLASFAAGKTKSLNRVILTIGFVWTVAIGGAYPQDRRLTFEERVRAQEAIQRVYYSHQIGASVPFEKAFPRELLERQVRDYLKQSDLLERTWHTPVTSAALQAELERIARHSRLPERLQEIYSALDDDPVLIEECFARRSLVDRLARSLFSGDERIHGEEGAQAEALRHRIESGNLSAEAADPHRSVVEVILDSTREGSERAIVLETDEASSGTSMSAGEFGKWRASLPSKIGETGSLRDLHDAFEFQVILSEEPGRVRVATYSFPKESWATWWESNRDSFHEKSVPAVALRADAIPGNPANSPGASRLAAVLPSSRGAELGLAPGPVMESTSCLQPSWDGGTLEIQSNPRFDHTAVWTGSRMILWGGLSEGHLTDTGLSYDPLTDNWEAISSLNAPSARAQHTAIWTGTKMTVWGGAGYLNTGGMYDPSTDTWTATSTDGAALGRVEHTAIWTGSEMIVFGGEVSNGTSTPGGGRFNPATNSWTPMTSYEARYNHTAVWTGSEMLVWGGRSGPFILSASARYNPATDTWSPFSSVNQPAARAAHGAVWTGSRMIIWGGNNISTSLSSGGRYDPASDTWTPTSSTNAPFANFPAGFWTGSEMLTWSSGSGKRYNPVADTWTTLPTLNAPSSYSDMAAVWTGSEMIVWGGRTSSSVALDTGARYNPAANAWIRTSFMLPAARERHTAVWTGNRMIVWGGIRTNVAIFNTGDQYDPVSDTWTPTSTVNAPSGRLDHSAVWTGSRMVIWGGSSDGFSLVLNSGGRYDPVSDTWTPTSLVNAPQGRNLPTAVWTGSKMIVWGGVIPGAPTYVNTGGIYDPALDTWSLTSTPNAPEGRAGHAAVWTGSRMVVWGGRTLAPTGSPGRYLNTGGQYNPTSDQWTSTSTAGAPIARTDHAFVWTGSRMILWGGAPGNARGSVFTGGRYDPLTDQWTSMSTTGAPHSRHHPTAVWTGSQMIVWGGVSEVTTTVNSGGVYDPALDQWIAATPSSGAPSARYRHTAVWTGSQMVVWGGNTGVGSQDGGRLRLDLLPEADADLDGFGACSSDCNDFEATIHPGATDVCNGLDDNCSAGADELFDQDQDGFATCGGDCNDSDPAINPPAAEICDHIDENCNSILDDGFPDADVDTWAACVDCNDNNNQIFPGQGDSCNGIDDDCDGVIDQWGNATCPPSTCHPGICGGLAGCLPSPVGTSCNDGNLCTQSDTCNASGSCIGGSPAVGAPCNDGSLCTQSDTCNASGSCVGSPVVCPPPPQCWATNSCTPATGLCNYSNPMPNGAACSDGNSCTIGDTCAVGLCASGPLRDADSDAYPDVACGGTDCNDSNSQVWSAPIEVMNFALTTANPATFSWSNQLYQAGFETVYDLASGILDGSGGINTASATCVQSGSSSTSYSDLRADPAPGTGYWYLARAKNSCAAGTYGAGSNDTPRSIPACP
jgi:N-acetylneuraminic acid mutarotase